MQQSIKNAINLLDFASRRAVVSGEAKKKQHACAYSGMRYHYCELFTQMIGLNF